MTNVLLEQQHAQFPANETVSLSNQPPSTPNALSAAKSNRGMLEAVLAAKLNASINYTQCTQVTETNGDKGLAIQLEDMVWYEAGHLEEIKRILRDRSFESTSCRAIRYN